jgi:hypothetical protein
VSILQFLTTTLNIAQPARASKPEDPNRDGPVAGVSALALI